MPMAVLIHIGHGFPKGAFILKATGLSYFTLRHFTSHPRSYFSSTKSTPGTNSKYIAQPSPGIISCHFAASCGSQTL